MAGLQTTVEPTIEPISATQLKEHLRLDPDSDDSEMDAYIKASREFVENYTNRSLINRTLKISIDGVTDGDVPLWEGMRVGPDISLRKRSIGLPRPPVVSVTSVTTFDDDDNSTLFAASKYYVDIAREPAQVILRNGETWPSALRVGNAIEIVYVAGYGTTATSVPESIRLAIKQYATYLFEARGEYEGSPQQPPQTVRMLLQPYVVRSFSTDPFNNGYIYHGA